MACKRSDNATIQVDVFNIIQSKVSALAQRFDNAIDEYYNNEMAEKAIM